MPIKQKQIQHNDEEILDYLQLIRSENVGPVSFYHLVKHYGGVKNALAFLQDFSKQSTQKSKKYYLAKRADVEKELAYAQKNNISFLTYQDAQYPPLLRYAEAAPPIIAVRGNIDLFQLPAISIVGSRNASAAGIQLTEQFTHYFNENGFIVVSGFARGIDTIAHHFSLKHGTIAVLAGGLDQIYPPENKKLYQAIAEQGVLMSEAPLKHIARNIDFPRRNRIIAACGMGLLVVEAAIRSGTLITARMASEIGRLVFAIPGSPLEQRAIGTNKLIKDGALIATCPQDVIETLKPLYQDPMQPITAPLTISHSKSRVTHCQQFDFFTPQEHPLASSASSNSHNITLEQKILSYLNTTPVRIEKLCDYTNASLTDIHLALTKLELAGKLARHIEGCVSLIPQKSHFFSH